MSTAAHEPVSPTWDALRKLGEQCPHPLKVEGECLIVLDSDRRRFTDLGTPEMAQFVLASVNYVRGILAQPAAPVLHNEKDLASYWKAAHDRVVAQNWELSRQIDALQKVGEQCLRPQQTPTGEGEVRPGCSKWGPSFPPSSCNAFVDCAHDGVCHDFDQCQIKGPAEPDDEDDANDAAALAHPQQGGERDGWKLVPVEPTEAMGKAYTEAFWRKMEDMRSPSPTEHPEDGGGPFGYAYRAMLAAAPTSPSKSSGEEA